MACLTVGLARLHWGWLLPRLGLRHPECGPWVLAPGLGSTGRARRLKVCGQSSELIDGTNEVLANFAQPFYSAPELLRHAAELSKCAAEQVGFPSEVVFDEPIQFHSPANAERDRSDVSRYEAEWLELQAFMVS